MSLSDAQLESIEVRFDAATFKWPPSGAAMRELMQLALEDLPALLAEVRACRQLHPVTAEELIEEAVG
ncbi:MAG: hypothetical protein QOH08_1155 [Chloroflexota bacterium]|jgi:hypothetical protein|nr:hypothetical protein [Chloroflexota bacterium]